MMAITDAELLHYRAFGASSTICIILSLIFKFSKSRKEKLNTHEGEILFMDMNAEEDANHDDEQKNIKAKLSNENYEMYQSFRREYLVVYTLAMASDWLQGPYIYDLYKSYGYSLNEIAAFFVTGYLSSAMFGTFAGSVADRYGRKFMALMFCIFFSLSCLSTLFSNFWVLIFGRFTGGLSSCLLFTVFESWMVSEHHSREFSEQWLSETFGLATYCNGLAAILSGLLANALASQYGPVAPCVASFLILVLNFVIIKKIWSENYGFKKLGEETGFRKIKTGLSTIIRNYNILLVGLIQCFFESSMYTFVFLWSPVLEKSSQAQHGALPYGIIFSCFMVSIMIGSLIFQKFIEIGISHRRIAQVTLFIAAVSLMLPCLIENSAIITFAFNIFEVCCGMYFPVIGSLKGKTIPEESRATIMSIFRVPLNLIVAFVLIKIDDSKTDLYFVFCGLLLTIAFSASSRLVHRGKPILS